MAQHSFPDFLLAQAPRRDTFRPLACHVGESTGWTVLFPASCEPPRKWEPGSITWKSRVQLPRSGRERLQLVLCSCGKARSAQTHDDPGSVKVIRSSQGRCLLPLASRAEPMQLPASSSSPGRRRGLEVQASKGIEVFSLPQPSCTALNKP